MVNPSGSTSPLTGPEFLISVQAAVESRVKGKSDVVELALVAMVARGHVLIEDVPGVGKSTLARTLAQSLGETYRRIQFTSDLLPADLVGTNVWKPRSETFEFRPGPIFANVVLADEINRSPPRSQSALLEAMSERQVSIDGVTHRLPSPFTVLATQNPQEHHGTYPLPESQRDRFTFRLFMGFASADVEAKLLAEHREIVEADNTNESSSLALPPTALIEAQQNADSVGVHADLANYAQQVVSATREHEAIRIGVSTRGALSWVAASRARAYLHGRKQVSIDDLQELANHSLGHRIVVSQDSTQDSSELTSELVRTIIASIPVPI